ncbi:MAG: family 78 glycoside hydrolase catalytic domain [Clostridia bacterium]|nr:family 78 glycoside hydrolase catalytic domain [Clostridia bacterium]
MAEEHVFTGVWITDDAFAALSPLRVFHRENAPMLSAHDASKQNAHILFRDTFTVTDRSAVTVCISADDYFKLYINGKFVMQGPAPSYPFLYRYNEADISAYVREGVNTLAVHTYYQGLVNRVWVSGDHRHGLLYDICEGTRVVACSRAGVKTHRHTAYAALDVIGYDTQFAERYDARAREVGFEQEHFCDEYWQSALPRRVTDYTLVRQRTAPLEIYTMPPAAVRVAKNEVFLDVGREIVGAPQFFATGRAGDTVEILCGEECNADGTVRYDMRCNCVYRDEMVLSGGRDEWRPFDYKAFRYVCLRFPDGVRIQDAAVQVRHYPFAPVRFFAASTPALQQVYDLCADTLHYGVQEGYLDCPSREKGQYFGDACYSATAHVWLTGRTELMEKLIEDALASTRIDAGGMALGPAAYMQETAEFPLMICVLLWVYYRLGGNIEFAESCLPAAEGIVSCYLKRYGMPLEKVDKWIVVEWPDNARDGYDFDLTPCKAVGAANNVLNAYMLFALRALARLRRALRKPANDTLCQTFAAAYRRTFYRENEARFTDGSKSEHTSFAAQIFGALTGVADGDEALRANVLSLIDRKRLSACNLFVTPVLFLLLQKWGEKERLYDLIADKNAWRNMLAQGATTTFEAFGKEKKWNTSLFHTMFAFPVCFLAENGQDLFSLLFS